MYVYIHMYMCVSVCVCVLRICVSVCACMCGWNKMNQEPSGKQVHLPEWTVFLTQNLGGYVKYQNKHRNKIEENTKLIRICM